MRKLRSTSVTSASVPARRAFRYNVVHRFTQLLLPENLVDTAVLHIGKQFSNLISAVQGDTQFGQRDQRDLSAGLKTLDAAIATDLNSRQAKKRIF